MTSLSSSVEQGQLVGLKNLEGPTTPSTESSVIGAIFGKDLVKRVEFRQNLEII